MLAKPQYFAAVEDAEEAFVSAFDCAATFRERLRALGFDDDEISNKIVELKE